MSERVYKICPEELWHEAQARGCFAGAPVDRSDGYIHFSTRGQVRETARRHFARQDGLLLLTVEAAALGDALRFEPARDGQLFPHLYGPLALSAVVCVEELPLGVDGSHLFPAGIP